MKSMSSFAALTALFAATNVMALERTSQGCFSSGTGMVFNDTLEFNSRGACGDNCYALQYATFAMTNSTYCFCGDDLPPASTEAEPNRCNIGCPGFGQELCGGRGYWSVYLTGMANQVVNAPAAPSDAPTTSPTTGPTASARPTVVTVAGQQTVVVTAGNEATSSPTATPSAASSGGAPSVAGIAAGVVVGVIVIIAIAGGLFFFMRSRKRKGIEEEYKRNAAVSNSIAGGKPPSSSGGASSFNDMRLDPAVMAQRRMSDGSIADNQDYSRRILKVTNA